MSYENIHVKETSGFVLLFTKQTKKCCSADAKTAALQSKNKHLLTVRFSLMNRLMSFWYCDSRGQHSDPVVSTQVQVHRHHRSCKKLNRIVKAEEN